MSTTKTSQAQLVRIPQQSYIHVLDQTTNVTRVERGPQTLICKQHEIVVSGPHQMVTIPPRHYVTVENPVATNEKNIVIFDDYGQAVLRWGEQQIKLAQDPFPLYPGEKLIQDVTPLQMVYKNEALHLLCVQGFTDEKNIQRHIGDEWLFEGPGVYVPNVNVEIVKKVQAVVIKQNEALRLRAIKDCVDRQGKDRTAGEEWIISTVGAYLPGVYEQQVSVLKARVLTDKKALHIKATRTFIDQFGIKRNNGQQWLITHKETETYIPSVNEEISRSIDITTLSSRQYCVIDNPYDEKLKMNHFGSKKLVIGEKSFFLYPNEKLANGIENVYVLNEEEGLVLTCVEAFIDQTKNGEISRKPGDRWLLRGPMEFIPPIGAKVLKKNKAICSDLQKQYLIYLSELEGDKSNLEEHGFVYVATNNNLKNQHIFKIGKTTNTLKKRMSTMSTSTIDNFEVMFAIKSKFPLLLENRIKDSLKKFRIRRKKEFYQLHYDILKGLLIRIASNYHSELELSKEIFETITKEMNLGTCFDDNIDDSDCKMSEYYETENNNSNDTNINKAFDENITNTEKKKNLAESVISRFGFQSTELGLQIKQNNKIEYCIYGRTSEDNEIKVQGFVQLKSGISMRVSTIRREMFNNYDIIINVLDRHVSKEIITSEIEASCQCIQIIGKIPERKKKIKRTCKK